LPLYARKTGCFLVMGFYRSHPSMSRKTRPAQEVSLRRSNMS